MAVCDFARSSVYESAHRVLGAGSGVRSCRCRDSCGCQGSSVDDAMTSSTTTIRLSWDRCCNNFCIMTTAAFKTTMTDDHCSELLWRLLSAASAPCYVLVVPATVIYDAFLQLLRLFLLLVLPSVLHLPGRTLSLNS